METTATEKTLRLDVGCEFRFEVTAPTPSVFLVRPIGAGSHHVRSEDWVMEPNRPFHDFVDLYGNVCRRTTLPTGWATVAYNARVDTVDEADSVDMQAPQLPVDELPDDTLIYTLASRYCLSDELGDRAWELFGPVEAGWPRAQAIMDYVHHSLQF